MLCIIGVVIELRRFPIRYNAVYYNSQDCRWFPINMLSLRNRRFQDLLHRFIVMPFCIPRAILLFIIKPSTEQARKENVEFPWLGRQCDLSASSLWHSVSLLNAAIRGETHFSFLLFNVCLQMLPPSLFRQRCDARRAAFQADYVNYLFWNDFIEIESFQTHFLSGWSCVIMEM